ncbi:hypothetical protein ABHV46_10555 [Asaia sp. BMEF1]|uniref:hypothetical protein n=1 Tax=Asaia sp. BMEF1 TaxID=3155932 RepID=UPI003F6652F1
MTILIGGSDPAQASPLPYCANPQEVLSGTRLTIGKAEGYFDWQSADETFSLRPVFRLNFHSCIPNIVSINAGVFVTRDRQIFGLSPQGLTHRGTARAIDPAFADHGETRRCDQLSTTADICLERSAGNAIVFIENHRPAMQHIPLLISRTKTVQSFAFLPSPDSPSGLVSLMIDRRTGYDFIMFDVWHLPEQAGFGPTPAQ